MAMTEITAPQRQDLSKDWYEIDPNRGLKILRDPTWEEYDRKARELGMLHQVMPMLIGDFINAGEDTFAERYSQVLDYFGDYSYGTVSNYAYVMRKVPFENRHPDLTYAYYKAVATLPKDEQMEAQVHALETGMQSKEFWDYTHQDEVREKTLADYLDDAVNGIGMLYQLTTTREQDQYLDQAIRQLMLAKESFNKHEQAEQA